MNAHCPRCEQLEEEVAYLKAELGLVVGSDDIQALRGAMRDAGSPDRIGRTSPASVVMALYRAKGRTLSKYQLMEAIPPRDRAEDDRNEKIVDVWICRARKGIGRDALENIWGKGYRLTPVGMARVAAILSPTSVAA